MSDPLQDVNTQAATATGVAQTDAAGNTLRGRGGDLIGRDRGAARMLHFEPLRGPALQVSPQGASSSVEGWVVMLSNLSPETTETDVRMLLADVDPTSDLMGGNNGGGDEKNDDNNNGTGFISDLRMNPAAASCGCVGHCFVKVPRLEFAYLIQKLNGRSFVDDLPVRVDFVFAVPTASSENGEQQEQPVKGLAGRGQRDRDAADGDGAAVKPSEAKREFSEVQ
jgi:hypothetical protein